MKKDGQWGTWSDQKEFDRLPELIKDALMVWEWYAYYDWEGASVEQVSTSQVIEIIDCKLRLTELANKMRRLKFILDGYQSKNSVNALSFEKRSELHNKITSDAEYRRLETEVVKSEDLVMKEVYRYLYKMLTKLMSF